MNTAYRKPLPGTKLDFFDAREAINTIQPGAYDTLSYTSRVHAENLVSRCDPAMLTDALKQLIERKRDLDRFKSAMQAAPEVMQCYYVTGNADFILMISARDMAEYEAFTRRHFFAEDNVLRFRTSAVMDRVKTGFAIPVQGD